MIKHINSFSQINSLKPNTLVVLDIDDTIMSFPNIKKEWWNETLKEYLYLGNERAYNEVESLWIQRIIEEPPELLDQTNLMKFLDQISNNNCELIFLTARDKKLSYLTIHQLEECNIIINPCRIFYNREKGAKLEFIVRNMYPNIKNIVFVDDLSKNLIDVAYTFNYPELFKYNLELYKIKH